MQVQKELAILQYFWISVKTWKIIWECLCGVKSLSMVTSTIRETRSSTKRGELLAGETNHFQPQIHNPLKSLTGLGDL
ncbi:hypothetical protein QQG55_33090 [Brugia pahangi]